MTICGMSAFAVAIGAKRTCPFSLHMSAYDPDIDQSLLVDGVELMFDKDRLFGFPQFLLVSLDAKS